MKFEKTKLEGVFIITPDVFGDYRGFFYGKLEPEENGRGWSVL